MTGAGHRLRELLPAARRRTLTAIGAGLVLLLGLLLFVPLPGAVHARGRAADPCAADALLVPPCGAWWGAYVPTGPDGLVASVDSLEQRTGRRLDLVYTYHDMGGGTDGQLLDPAEQQLGRDHLLMLSWESDVWSDDDGGSASTPLGWAKIAAGDYDATVIDPQAERVKAYGRTVLIALDQEMDSRTPADGSPADFVAAYRHVVDRFRQLGADNVRWVWTITGYMAHTRLFSAMYPGDGYVDWIGYDQYNYYGCKRDPHWLSFAQAELPAYTWLRAHISATKPLMLAEYSTAVDAADPAAQQQWYQQVPGVLQRQLPGVKAVVQWDSSVPGPDCDLSLDTPPALAGFAEAGRSSYLRQPLP
ncbi:hypothetical protein GXW83_25470 [Streptacidiphilus sp. PB12-B1b]|uniref:glycoside hydrolase family 26 protein n=1 Tax=Streptacidiphilus sp. PB12-B1b TaxID=2705012 RepID=UPI0015FBD914|nr:glycosyl hydrolase [Streptacidiphilus sp. PB12-B1b]QMU78558.1 hypothetical protein GXW83_25470 [Streptacidiphilus sp. PB12-B1b]